MIPHPRKDRRRHCTPWTAAGHPHGDHQGMVIKGWGGRRKKKSLQCNSPKQCDSPADGRESTAADRRAWLGALMDLLLQSKDIQANRDRPFWWQQLQMLIKGQVLHVFNLEGAAASPLVFASTPPSTGTAIPISYVVFETKGKSVCVCPSLIHLHYN